MVEKITRVLKVFAALSILLLTFLLLVWVFSINLNYSFLHIALIIIVVLLALLFGIYAYMLLRQVVRHSDDPDHPGILDDDVIENNHEDDRPGI